MEISYAENDEAQHGLQPTDDQPLARAENQESKQIELLEAHGERLDLEAAGTAGAGDQAMATVGTRDRSAND